nr:hypothetical protein [Tanacetum cinerariifolium]
MANLSEDIQCAGSDTRPPMLDRIDFASWQQCIRLYCRGKENEVENNLESILTCHWKRKRGDTNREVNVTETINMQTDDGVSKKELKQIEADDQAIQTILLGLPKDIYTDRISSNPRNRQIAQPSMNMGQDRQMQMVGGNGRNQFRQYEGQNAGNPAGYNDVIGNLVIQNAVQNLKIENGNLVAAHAEGNAARQNGNHIMCYNCKGVGHYARNRTVMPKKRDIAYLQTQLLIAQKEEAGIQLQAGEYDLMAAAADLDEIKEVNANCILMANLHVEQGGETVEQHPANFAETRALYVSLYQNLAIEVEKVNSVNRKLKETNVDLITELARFKNQTKCFEISQEKYDKFERCYQQSVYQEQCLSKKINAFHLSTVVSSFHDSLEKVAVSLLNHAQQEDHAFQVTLFRHTNIVVSSELA